MSLECAVGQTARTDGRHLAQVDPDRQSEALPDLTTLKRPPFPLPRNFPGQYRPPMHSEDRSKLRTAELMDDGADAGFVGSLTDQPTEIRRMKLSIRARSGPDLLVKLLHLGILVALWIRL